MELLVARTKFTELSSIGDFYVDGVKKWVTLEDTNRGLTNQMALAEIAKIKIKSKTAIPTGRYKVIKYNSPQRGWCLLVIDVPGFSMIEIHVGNYPQDTDGCTLVGLTVSSQLDAINNSKIAIKALYELVFPVLESGKDVYITYINS